MNEGLDTGDILSQTSCEIFSNDTSGSLSERLSQIGADLLLKTIENIEKNNITPRKQNNAAATYASKIQKQQAQLDWTKPADYLARCVRAYNPTPVAYTQFNQALLRVWQAACVQEPVSEKPGTLLRVSKDGIDIATGKDTLRLLQIQMPGKKSQSALDFIHAYHQQLIPLKTLFR